MTLAEIKVNNVYCITEYAKPVLTRVVKLDDDTHAHPVHHEYPTSDNSTARYFEHPKYLDNVLDIVRVRPGNYKVTCTGYAVIHVTCEIKELLAKIAKTLDKTSKLDKETNLPEDVIAKGKELTPEVHVLKELPPEEIIATGSILERYTKITGEVSKATANINEQFSLADAEDLKVAFLAARNKIESLTSTKPGAVSFLSKYASKIPFANKLAASVSSTISETSSAQKNINYLFGVINDKYEKLINVGESFQEAKASITSRITALEELSTESKAHLSTFGERPAQPIRDIATDVQISSSIETLKSRLVKIDGAIMATQNTIFVFGKDLPALKADLTDETAVGNLLSTVDDYQKMGQEVAALVANVTTATAEKTHAVIENLLDVQIKDTHTMQYLEHSSKRAEKFGKMVETKSKVLAHKVMRDAEFITSIVQGNSVEYARKNIPKIGNK